MPDSKRTKPFKFREHRGPAASASEIRAAAGVTRKHVELVRAAMRRLGMLVDEGSVTAPRRQAHAK